MPTQFRIPYYDKATNKFFRRIADHFISLDPLLSGIKRVPDFHRGPTRNVRGEKPLDQELFPIKTLSSIHHDDIKSTNIDAFTTFIMNIIEQLREGMHKNFFETLNAVTDATGQKIDAKGQPFSFDQMLDLLEKMTMEFDADNQPLMPTMIMAPEMYEKIRATKPTDDQEKRLREVIAKKKAEFDAQKRTRRLS